MSQREELAVQLAARERGLADAETRLADARLTLAARTSAAESLRELERVREGYDSGVRAIFEAAEREGRVGVDGVVGPVADLLDVPPDLERAVEAVLAERLAWVVVERFDQARAAVTFLQERGAGAATFLPLECLSSASDPLPEDDGVRWIARRVTAPRESLVHFLLGQVAIVDHLDQAETLWRRNGVSATYVTPNGEVLARTGRLRGGAGGGEARHSLLARKRRLRELDEQIRELTETVGITQTTVAQTEADVAALRVRIAECEQTVGQRQAERVAGEKDLEQAIREHEREHRHAETVRIEAGQGTRESDETRAMLARLEQRVASAREAESARRGDGPRPRGGGGAPGGGSPRDAPGRAARHRAGAARGRGRSPSPGERDARTRAAGDRAACPTRGAGARRPADVRRGCGRAAGPPRSQPGPRDAWPAGARARGETVRHRPRQPRRRRGVSRARRAAHVSAHTARRPHRVDQGPREGVAGNDAHRAGTLRPGLRADQPRLREDLRAAVRRRPRGAAARGGRRRRRSPRHGRRPDGAASGQAPAVRDAALRW